MGLEVEPLMANLQCITHAVKRGNWTICPALCGNCSVTIREKNKETEGI